MIQQQFRFMIIINICKIFNNSKILIHKISNLILIIITLYILMTCFLKNKTGLPINIQTYKQWVFKIYCIWNENVNNLLKDLLILKQTIKEYQYFQKRMKNLKYIIIYMNLNWIFQTMILLHNQYQNYSHRLKWKRIQI